MRLPGTSVRVTIPRWLGGSGGRRRGWRLTALQLGVAFVVASTAAGVAVFNRHHLSTALKGGSLISANFSRDYLLQPYTTPVKEAGVPIGIVTGVTQVPGGARVQMKIYGNGARKLGTAPRAWIRLRTLLAGNSYVQLDPGGAPGTPRGTIPFSRTTIPVYFDNILSALTPPAREGMRRSIDQFDQTLRQGGEGAAASALAKAPPALAPARRVLRATQGPQPGDLTGLVQNLSRTDTVLTRQEGQLESVVSGLHSFSRSLGNESRPLAATVANLPADLGRTRAGLAALDTTLAKLDTTAGVARPSVRQLSALVSRTQPVLVQAQPVLAQLPSFLDQADPVLHQLVPTAVSGRQIIGDVHGPVLDRVLNPIIPALNQSHRAPPQTVSATLYQEMGYTLAHLDGVTAYYDATGHLPPVIMGESPRAAAGEPTPPPGAHRGACGGEPCPTGSVAP